MVSTIAPICDFGWKPTEFRLAGVDGKVYTLADIRGPQGTLVAFICNHCPYVKAVVDRLVRDASELSRDHGIGVLAIMPNDTAKYPEDSFENMKAFANTHRFTFPYVIDETQETAKAWGAVCTPDFFGFNADMELQYRGRLDESGRQAASPGIRRDLFEAMVGVARTSKGPQEQIASMGCSIKWRDPS